VRCNRRRRRGGRFPSVNGIGRNQAGRLAASGAHGCSQAAAILAANRRYTRPLLTTTREGYFGRLDRGSKAAAASGPMTDGPTSWNPGGETAPTALRRQKTWRWSWSATCAGSVRSPGSFRTPTIGLARRTPTSLAGIAASGTAARSPGTRRAPWVTHCRRRRSASAPCRARVHARRRGPRSRWRGRACDTRAR